jgi:hypothetical protein
MGHHIITKADLSPIRLLQNRYKSINESLNLSTELSGRGILTKGLKQMCSIIFLPICSLQTYPDMKDYTFKLNPTSEPHRDQIPLPHIGKSNVLQCIYIIRYANLWFSKSKLVRLPSTYSSWFFIYV